MEYLTPLTGRSWEWARDGGLVGGIVGYTAPACALFGLSAHPWLWASCATGAAFGAILGGATPGLLRFLRRRTSIVTLSAVLPLGAFALATVVAWALATAIGAPVAETVLFGSLAAGIPMALFFVPYLVLTVLGERRWPVVLLAAGSSVLTGGVARLTVLGVVSPLAAVVGTTGLVVGLVLASGGVVLLSQRAPALRSTAHSPSQPYILTQPR